MTKSIKAVKKLEDGKIAVQWSGIDEKFYRIDDDEIAVYIMYLTINTPEDIVKNQNSMCR